MSAAPLVPLSPDNTRRPRSGSDAGTVHHVSETPENADEIEYAKESGGAATPEPAQAGVAPERTGRPWKKFALVAGGGVLTAACAVVVTLAATHKSAVTQNAAAYANGLLDGYETYKSQL